VPKDIERMNELVMKGQLDVSVWESAPPRFILNVKEADINELPDQVFVLCIEREDGKQCRFSIAISKGEQNLPKLTVRSCKTPLGADLPNIDVDTVKTVSGRYIDYDAS
jgi:hypothetical protein